MIAYNLGTNPSYTYTIKTTFSSNKWINLRINQIDGVYETKIDNKLTHRTTNDKPKRYANVKIITGSYYAQYRNFEINTCYSKGRTIKNRTIFHALIFPILALVYEWRCMTDPKSFSA